ncbi:hypothetical protein amb0844 [Paramagnetospirillum magneticum AMB-1]|uniref:Uncharacterized protein n=1 Tax=Paramagnetospirillum magneticum (strain ATCC 700264 / AMB-1) TaxID=342108 RepID=Q2W927_PARM1|nr:hypothetical protein amb0844 [Paramagnetospirillum magneticum AMB-1]
MGKPSSFGTGAFFLTQFPSWRQSTGGIWFAFLTLRILRIATAYHILKAWALVM